MGTDPSRQKDKWIQYFTLCCSAADSFLGNGSRLEAEHFPRSYEGAIPFEASGQAAIACRPILRTGLIRWRC